MWTWALTYWLSYTLVPIYIYNLLILTDISTWLFFYYYSTGGSIFSGNATQQDTYKHINLLMLNSCEHRYPHEAVLLITLQHCPWPNITRH